jgi:putative oxidoreductase
LSVNDQLPLSEGSIVRNVLSKTVSTPLQDLALLAARVLLGVVLIAHGWQKLDDQGLHATAAGFESMGIPAPLASAYYATFVELVGGGLLVLGLLTRLVGVLVVGDMLGAFWFAHRGTEVFADQGGWELVAVIGAVALGLVAAGAGRISVDAGFTRATGVALAPDALPQAPRDRELVDSHR